MELTQFTVTQAELEELLDNSQTEQHIFAEGKEMCVVYILPSGFTVNGRAAMLDPRFFSLEIGQQLCREDAIDQLWQLEAYRKSHERYYNRAKNYEIG